MGFLKSLNPFRRGKRSSSTVEEFEACEDGGQSPREAPSAAEPELEAVSGPTAAPATPPAPVVACVVQDLTSDGDDDDDKAPIPAYGDDELESVEPADAALPPAVPLPAEESGAEKDDPCEASLEVVNDLPTGAAPAASADAAPADPAGFEHPPLRPLELGPATIERDLSSPEVGARRRFLDSGPLPKAKPCKPRSGLQLQGLVVRGRGFKGLAAPEPILPGMMADDPDEFLMDGILEETGMVFGGSGLVNVRADAPLSCSGSPFVGAGMMGASGCFGATGSSVPLGVTSSSMPDVGISMADSSQFTSGVFNFEEHMRIEAELMSMGLDLEELDEQQALLHSLQRQMALEPDTEVAVLLDSLQADMSLSSMYSIEAC